MWDNLLIFLIIFINIYNKQILTISKEKMNQNKRSSYQNKNKFNFCSKPLQSLHLPQKIQIKSLGMSESGQAGVIFIQILQGSFIVKPSVSVPNQLFYNEMARQLGLRVPNFITFSIQDNIHGRLLAAISKYCGSSDECLFVRIKSKFNSLFYAIIQYIPSIGLEHIGKQRFKNNLLSSERLHEFGLCLGFDMIINNHDRFQCIWSGDGNLANVLIRVPNFDSQKEKQLKNRDNLVTPLDSLVFIDNSGNMCDVKNKLIAKNIELYTSKMVAFFKQILGCLESSQVSLLKNTNLLKFVNHIQLYTQYKLGQSELRQVVLGIKDIFKCFIYCHKIKRFDAIWQQVKNQSTKMQIIKNQWLQQVGNINMNYCDLLYERVKPILKQHNLKIKQNKMLALLNAGVQGQFYQIL